jgi:hypothetical protein
VIAMRLPSLSRNSAIVRPVCHGADALATDIFCHGRIVY